MASLPFQNSLGVTIASNLQLLSGGETGQTAQKFMEKIKSQIIITCRVLSSALAPRDRRSGTIYYHEFSVTGKHQCSPATLM